MNEDIRWATMPALSAGRRWRRNSENSFHTDLLSPAKGGRAAMSWMDALLFEFTHMTLYEWVMALVGSCWLAWLLWWYVRHPT